MMTFSELFSSGETMGFSVSRPSVEKGELPQLLMRKRKQTELALTIWESKADAENFLEESPLREVSGVQVVEVNASRIDTLKQNLDPQLRDFLVIEFIEAV